MLDLKRLFTQNDSLQIGLIVSTFTCCIGALMSGLLVILDWQVDWQAFPTPSVIGCLIGEFCGLLAVILIHNVMHK